MIINFSVQNFGSIRDKQTLSFEADRSDQLEDYYVFQPVAGLRLLKLGLIYGANASGKTTLLKALDFLRDIILNPETRKTQLLNFKPFLFDADTPGQTSLISIEFIPGKVRYRYEVEFNRNAIVNETLDFYDPNKATVFKRTTELDKQLAQISFGSKIRMDRVSEKMLESNTLWNNTVLGGFLKTNIALKALKEVTDWFASYLRPIVFTRTNLDDYVTERMEEGEIDKSTIINILRKADFNISDILVKDGENITEAAVKMLSAMEVPDATIEKLRDIQLREIEFEHTVNDNRYFLPFNEESEGTKRYYGFAGLLGLLINRQVAMPIDELESSLHPDLFVHFLLSFLVNAKRSQIIATTHNREILSDKGIFRNDAIWFTEKDERDSTDLYSLADFDSSVVRDTSSVYNAYKIGKLGGVPNLGDHYIDVSNEGK